MPLRNHFPKGQPKLFGWDRLHGMWPGMMVVDLNSRLPPNYVAAPNIHLGGLEFDVATVEQDAGSLYVASLGDAEGGVATALWAPPTPTVSWVAGSLDVDEYEVQIVDVETNALVAVIEIVSPSNKDRPDSRKAFISKCSALLQRGVSVAIVDVVTSRSTNLYLETVEMLGYKDDGMSEAHTSTYAAEIRWRRTGSSGVLESWAHPLAVGQTLPTLPLWVSAYDAISLDLESSYEASCRALRLA